MKKLVPQTLLLYAGSPLIALAKFIVHAMAEPEEYKLSF